jgi:ABC-type transport system involved in cytochrome c biogenesis permease subunit
MLEAETNSEIAAAPAAAPEKEYGGPAFAQAGGAGLAVATLAKPTVAEIRARQAAALTQTALKPRALAMQATAARIKPLSNFTYRAMQVGVLLVAAGTILGGVWADVSWGRFWGWDAKEVWALITLLVYLVPLHGRFAGWVNTFTLTAASVVCFASVLMAWYGVNFVLNTGLHTYGFAEGGGQGVVLTSSLAVVMVVAATAWRRKLASA